MLHLPEVKCQPPFGSLSVALATSKCVWKQLCRWPRMFYRKYYLNIGKDRISPVRNYKSGFHFLSFHPPSPPPTPKPWEKNVIVTYDTKEVLGIFVFLFNMPLLLENKE